MKKLIPILLLTALISGCYYDKSEELYPTTPVGGGSCDTSNVTYSSTITGIAGTYCAVSGCHNSSTVAGGYDLSVYSGWKQTVDNNRLLGSINHQSGFSAMPKNSNKLSDCQIAQVTAWVNKGAQNN